MPHLGGLLPPRRGSASGGSGSGSGGDGAYGGGRGAPPPTPATPLAGRPGGGGSSVLLLPPGTCPLRKFAEIVATVEGTTDTLPALSA